MNCSKVERTISAYLDGEATASEWQAVQAHVRGCQRCARTLSAFEQTTHVFKKETTPAEPSREVWSRVAAGIASLERPRTHVRFLGWLQELAQRFIIRPPAALRFAQVGVALAAIAYVILLRMQSNPQSPYETSMAVVDTDEVVPSDWPPPPDHNSRDEGRFLRAGMVRQVRSYLEKAGILLLEVKNSESELDSEELTQIRESSGDLLEETVLIKETLKDSELSVLMKTVEQLEMLLFDAANLNTGANAEDLELLKATILQNDLLIKIEIYDAKALESTTRPEPLSKLRRQQI